MLMLDNTYYNDYYKSRSLIDHFLVTKTLYEYVEKCYCLCEEVDNASNHRPIIIQSKIDLKKQEITFTVKKSRKSWNIASNGDVCLYKHILDEMLNNISIPTDCIICTNVLCTNNFHIDSIQRTTL